METVFIGFPLNPHFLGSPVSGVPEIAPTFSDSLEGLTGLNIELCPWPRLITAGGHTTESARRKDAGGVWRNPCTGFWWPLPSIGVGVQTVLLLSDKCSNMCAECLPITDWAPRVFTGEWSRGCLCWATIKVSESSEHGRWSLQTTLFGQAEPQQWTRLLSQGRKGWFKCQVPRSWLRTNYFFLQ